MGHLVITLMPHCFENNTPASLGKIQYVDRVVHGMLVFSWHGTVVGFDAGRLVGRTELAALENIHTLTFGDLGRVPLILLSP